MSQSNPVTEIDLNAYVDGQLDTTRRIEVEEYLSHNAADAMRVMQDLRIRDALQWVLTHQQANPVDGVAQQLARRLDKALGRARALASLQRLAACLVLVAVGWAGHVGFSTWSAYTSGAVNAAPVFVDDAVRAHRVAQVRTSILPYVSPVFDAGGIFDRTGIALPDFPPDWAVDDVQVWPTGKKAYGIEVIVDTGPAGQVSVFATHAVEPGVSKALAAQRDGDAGVVYWQQDEWAYALTADLPTVELERMAARLAM